MPSVPSPKQIANGSKSFSKDLKGSSGLGLYGVGDLVRDGKEKGGDIAGATKKGAGDIARETKKAGADTSAAGKKGGGVVAKQGKKTAGDATKATKDAVGTAAKSGKEQVGGVVKQGKDMAGDVARETKKAGGDASAAGKIGGGVIAKQGKKTAGDATKATEDAVGTAVKSGKEQVGGVVKQGKDMAGDVSRETKNGLGNFSREGKKAAGDLSREGKRTAGDFSRAGKATGGVIAKEGRRVAGDISRTGKQAVVDTRAEAGRLGGVAAVAGTEIIRQTTAVGNDISREAGALAANARDLEARGREVYDNAKELEARARQAAGDLEGEYYEAKDDFNRATSGDPEALIEVLEKRTGHEMPEEIRNKLKDANAMQVFDEFENATGLEIPPNVRARAEQAQAMISAARSGKLSNVEEAAGAESNRNTVQAEKAKGWDDVVYGNEIDHEEYVKMTGAVGASIATGNAGPFMAYAETWATEQMTTLQDNLTKSGKSELAKKINKEMLIDALQNSLDGKPATLPISGVKIDVGVATYNHRMDVSAGIPEWTSKGIEVNQQGAEVTLPNTHQPYVRFKFED